MKTLQELATLILDKPAPVLFLDTCALIDVFRFEEGRYLHCVKDLEACHQIVDFLSRTELPLYVVVPRLVSLEFQRNAAKEYEKFNKAIEMAHNLTQSWLELSGGSASPTTKQVPPSLGNDLHQLVGSLLNLAEVMNDDLDCIRHAIERAVQLARPSQDNKINDSIILEHVLELCRRLVELSEDRFPRVFVSSNSKDYNLPQTGPLGSLKSQFNAVKLEFRSQLHEGWDAIRDKFPSNP